MSVGDVWDRAEKRQEQHEADLRAHIVELDAELKRLHSRRGWCSVCEERHEVGDCPVLPDSPYHRAEQAEAERDQANTSAIAQRRSFEKALEGRDEIIAELEGENERLRRVIGAAVEDSANLEAERDEARREANISADNCNTAEAHANNLQAELAAPKISRQPRARIPKPPPD